MMQGRIYEDRAYGPDPIRDSYWATTAKAPTDPSAAGDMTCDVAIVGGGFTGLNAAITLAKAGVDIVVLEANYIGFGASGRNGGFCCLGGEKLSQSNLLARYGAAETALFRHAQKAAIDHVSAMLETHNIDADRHSSGETILAHRPKDMAEIRDDAQRFEAFYGEPVSVFDKGDLADQGLNGPEFHGASTLPFGFALNPLKYVLGLRRVALQAGARIFGHTDVTSIQQHGDGWTLQTTDATISANRFILATNGYSRDTAPDWLRARYLPTQSSIMVTRPLSDAEIRDQGFWSRQMCYDSRTLLHYFRLLPDNRFLFGMRAATRASGSAFEATRQAQIADFQRMFPAWAGVDVPHFWSGLLCISRALVPFVGALKGHKNGWGAFAFHGNGVAFASYAGHALAQEILGQTLHAPMPEFVGKTPPKFELGRYRRALLPLVYLRYKWADR